MAPSANYCGECREIYYDEDFPCCRYGKCESLFEHDSGHGYYCIYCLEKGKKKDICKKYDNYFCNKHCYKEWVKDD